PPSGGPRESEPQRRPFRRLQERSLDPLALGPHRNHDRAAVAHRLAGAADRGEEELRDAARARDGRYRLSLVVLDDLDSPRGARPSRELDRLGDRVAYERRLLVLGALACVVVHRLDDVLDLDAGLLD